MHFPLCQSLGALLYLFTTEFSEMSLVCLYNMVLMASSWPYFLTRAFAKSPNMTRFAIFEGFV